MAAIRLILLLAALGLLASEASARPARHVSPSPRHAARLLPRDVPLPPPRPAIKSKLAARGTHASHRKNEAREPASVAARDSAGFTTASIPASGVLGYENPDQPGHPAAFLPDGNLAPQARPVHHGIPLAIATTANTSPLDLAAVKAALDLANKGRASEATTIEHTIADPLARKLVEWAILRGEDLEPDFPRYAAFIAENPSWPGIRGLRRRAEAALWQQNADPRTVLDFLAGKPPLSVKGRFAVARALLAQGDRAGAQAELRKAWRADAFSADLEEQARGTFAGLITPADDKARMDARLFAGDDDAGLRAAHHLDAVQFAIAKARAAVINRSARARTLLDAVPAEARRDPGYVFSRIQWLRHTDEIDQAARWLMAVPRQAQQFGDADQWWVERRVIARKLLDLGKFKAAYEVAAAAAIPHNENYRSDQQFTAGWIALRFLRQPELALSHFARVGEGATNPITLARAYYWQGRAAEALGRDHEARGYYETAARYPTAYYGQLARARLGFDAVGLRQLPEPPPEHRRLEVVRAFEILYAVDARDLAAVMAADLAETTGDAGALAALADIATRHRDARATLLVGKIALGRGMPFERYAFPDFGVPNYQQIGPQVARCVVYSIVRQESAFNPRVISSAHAIGLMQVTPDAGRDTARRFNVSFNQRRLMADVAYNAQLGTAELGHDIATWRGSYILAFVAYNAGPRRAKEWIEQYGDPRNPRVDPIDWIERIPLAETRNYVERVLENMQVYRARLDHDPRLLIEADLRRGG